MERPPELEVAALLDRVAAAVFGGPAGEARLSPLLRRFDEAVGVMLDEDGPRELFLAMRLDWALCDAVLEADGVGPGAPPTWLGRVLAGRVDGVTPEPAWDLLAATYAGVFEIWPGSKFALARDLLHGLCVRLLDPLELLPVPDGPAALFDARVVLLEDGARLCREPLGYPLEVHPLLLQGMRASFGEPPRADDRQLALRRAWVEWQRQPRIPPSRPFRAALGLPAEAGRRSGAARAAGASSRGAPRSRTKAGKQTAKW